jgi:hypothetical protein
MPPTRILPCLAALALLAGALAGVAHAKTSHAGWPAVTGVLRIAPNHDTRIRGTVRSDELLGGHGSDVINGRSSGDILWGDKNPCCQPTGQRDVMYGGGGRDFIYASHGRNIIFAGSGNDVVHAHFGTGGRIDCGSGNDIVYLSHRSRPHYRVRHCERISFFTLGY